MSPRRTARLAVVHYTTLPVLGGVELVLDAQARHLSASGYDVKIVTGRGQGERIEELDSRHPAVERLYRRLAEGGDAGAEFGDLQAVLADRFERALADRDLVIVHNVLTMPFNLPATAALGESGKRLVAWTHDHGWLADRYSPLRREEWPYDLMKRRWPSMRMVAITDTRRRELRPLYRGVKITVIPNGMDPGPFLGIGVDTVELVRRAGAEEADPLLIAPVRITRRKRLEQSIEAVAELRTRWPDIHLLVTGPLGAHDRDNQAYLLELLGLRARLGLDGCVSFLHQLSEPDGSHPVSGRNLAELYRRADAVLLTSDSEGFGLPVLEASVARAPIVCADLPVLREVGGAGAFRFPLGADARAVAAVTERALLSRPARFRRRSLARYGWPAVTKLTSDYIEALLGG